MTTLVYRIQDSGSLQQVQIGAADVVALLAAANTTWGWLGGLDGIRHLLTHIRGPSIKWNQLKAPKEFKFDDTTCGILTSKGVVLFQDDDASHAFGGDFRTQTIGLMLCALAHECRGPQAVHLFMQCLTPSLLIDASNENAGIKEAFHAHLNDNYAKILNEGTARGLNRRFDIAIQRTGLPTGRRYNQGSSNTTYTAVKERECHMVGGLLKWIVCNRRQDKSYLTRSSLVARVAACLKEVGCPIGQVQIWNGTGPIPQDTERAAFNVVLVLGGTCQTDPLMLSDEDHFHKPIFQYHYRLQTIGSMFLNSMPHSDLADFDTLRHEVFQARFDDIHSFFQDNLTFSWESVASVPMSGPQAVAKWKIPASKSSSIAIRLAAFNFKSSAELVAPCYELIADEAHLNAILPVWGNTRHDAQRFYRATTFRVITASIVFSIISVLAGDTFETLNHVTTFDMCDGPLSWLKILSAILDPGLRTSLTLQQAVVALAAAHAGYIPSENEFSESDLKTSDIIGYRALSFSVLPNLLFEMKPTTSSLGLRCTDQFIGNIPTDKDNFVRSVDNLGLNPLSSRHLASSDFEEPGGCYSEQAWIGYPSNTTQPSDPLHLSIERSALTIEPTLVFSGRIAGELVGQASVQNILLTLGESLSIAAAIKCPGHSHPQHVLNVRTNLWTERWSTKPLHSSFATYLHAGEDRCWALLLIGQACFVSAIAVFGCFDCTMDGWLKDKQPAHHIAIGISVPENHCDLSVRAENRQLQLTNRNSGSQSAERIEAKRH